MSNIDWDNAPEGAEFYAFGSFRKYNRPFRNPLAMIRGSWVTGDYKYAKCVRAADYCERPQTHTEQREADDKPDWSKAPKGATHYGDGRYWMSSSFGFVSVWSWHDKFSNRWKASNESPVGHHDFTLIPQPQQSAPIITQEPPNKYSRQIVGLDGKTCQIDVYRVLAAFEVDSHPVAHAIKKLLAPGMRHAKTREQDLKEAIASIEAELLMMEQAE